jgi:hypothetical protein
VAPASGRVSGGNDGDDNGDGDGGGGRLAGWAVPAEVVVMMVAAARPGEKKSE